MVSYPANSFFNNFTKLFNSTEKTEDTPVLSSFSSLSEKDDESRNIGIQKPHTIKFDNESPVERDLKALDGSSEINSKMTSETEVLIEPKVVLAKTIQPTDECNNYNNLGQRSSLEQIRDNNAETHINSNMDQVEAKNQETPTHIGKEFLDMDLKVNMEHDNSWKDSSLACQGDQRMADGQADLLSKAFSQEYNDASLRNTAPDESHRSGDLSDCINKQIAEGLPDRVMRDGNATNITKSEVLSTAQHEGNCQEWTNQAKHMQTKTQEPSRMNNNEEPYTEDIFQTGSTDMNNPISTIAISDQADQAMSTFKSNLVIPNGDFGTNTKCTHSDNNTIQQKEEFWSSLSPDTCNGCHVESDRQSSSETGDTFLKVKSDRALLQLEQTTPDSLDETQKWSRTNNVQELSKLEMNKNGGQDRGTMLKDESDDPVQIQGENKERAMKEEKNDILQEDSNSESLGIPSAPGNTEEPPNTENASRRTRRVTFSPGLKLEKPPHLPSIFSGLKGFKKEMHDQQKNALTLEQPKSPVLMKRASVKRTLFSEKHPKVEAKGSILEQLSQLLSFDSAKVGAKKPQEPIASPPLSPSSEAPVTETPPVEESVEGPDVASPEESGKLTNTETALNAFKAFFTPKPAKRDTSDHIDLDAVKRAFNPETIRAIFDRNSSKSPDNKTIFEKVCT